MVYCGGLEITAFSLVFAAATTSILTDKMGRGRQTIEGAISEVSSPRRHPAGGYRIRFKLNGVPTAVYRANKADADTLFEELRTRAAAQRVGINMVATSLSPRLIREAELAVSILIDANVIAEGVPSSYSRLPFAASKLVEALKRQGANVSVEQAWRQYLHKQKPRVSDITYKGYTTLGRRFVAQMGAERSLSSITSLECFNFINALPSKSSQFRFYGYLAAFFAFCTGKFNPAIRPGLPGWISASPMNFERTRLDVGNIVSYTYDEVRRLLAAAKDVDCLGYILFRLFSMVRYDEMLRFISQGGSSFAKHPRIDLSNNRIHFDSTVFRKRGTSRARGRYVSIHPTFRAWIDYCVKNDIWFSYNRLSEQAARKVIESDRSKDGKNLLRHTAITMHLKNFGSIVDTAVQAGTSPQIIQDHYFNVNIANEDAKRFYGLTPAQMGFSSSDMT